MSDQDSKPGIPAWQRAQPQSPPAAEDPVYSQPEASQNTSSEPATTLDAALSPSNDVPAASTSAQSPTTSPPAEALERPVAIKMNDFESFKQQYQTPRREPAAPPKQQAPPIITYPEFLVDAHRPPPLITPSRVINAVYVAGAAVTLAYAASKWIINPMVESLTEARHDFLGHSQGKVDEFNERLSKIVTTIPEPKKSAAGSELEVDEVASVASDPTELYHRDMGTQTSPIPTRRSSDVAVEGVKKDVVNQQTSTLLNLKDKIQELVDGSESLGKSHKARQGDVTKLRHDLDNMLYSTPTGLKVWQYDDDASSRNKDKGLDAVEELKKEIRGVKGVLLSAKRFPAVHSMTFT